MDGRVVGIEIDVWQGIKKICWGVVGSLGMLCGDGRICATKAV